MAAGAFLVYGGATEAIAKGTMDLDGGKFYMTLVTSAYTPSQGTHTDWSSVSASETTGTGYTAGGNLAVATTGNLIVTRSSLVVTVDCDDQSWASSTITAKYAVIVQDISAGALPLVAGDKLLCYCDLSTGGGSVSTTNGAFSITINASGLFTITNS